MSDQLVPKLPRVMKQPTKARMRELLAASASEVEQLRAQLEEALKPPRRWWHRFVRPARHGHVPPERFPTEPPASFGHVAPPHRNPIPEITPPESP